MHKIARVFAISLVLVLGLAAMALADAKQDFNNATQALRAGDNDTAIRLYTKIINSRKLVGTKYEAWPWEYRAVAHKRKKMYRKAMRDYNMAAKIDPRDAETFYNRGILQGVLHKYTKALADYTRAIELKPGYAKAYGNRANVLMKLGHHDEALADAEKGVELDPHNKTVNRAILRKIRKQLGR